MPGPAAAGDGTTGQRQPRQVFWPWPLAGLPTTGQVRKTRPDPVQRLLRALSHRQATLPTPITVRL